MKRSRHLRWVLPIVIAVVVIAGLAVTVRGMATPDKPIPTTRVERGNVEIQVHSDGELRPVQSASLTAPSVGGALQIVYLAPVGEMVKQGDTVISFDPSDQQFRLEQARFDLQSAEQEITKAKADAAVQSAQDKVDLLKARYDVRRAELDVSRNELLSSIDAQKNNLALEEARRRLAQLEQDVQSRSAVNQAALQVAQEKRNHALVSMKQAQDNIDHMTVKSPINGVVSIKTNMDAAGGFFFSGMVLPQYHEGDTASSGRTVAEVLQVSQLEIQGKINESDRGNVNAGEPVQVRIDALPSLDLKAKVKTVAGLVSRDWFGDNSRRFDAVFTLDNPGSQLHPGETAHVVIQGTELKNVLFVPRQAVFDKNGKPVVYKKVGGHFEAQEIKIVNNSESKVALDGLPEGTEVALVNPDQQSDTKRASTGPSVGGGK